MANFSQFVTRLHDDTAFRTLFAKSQAQALQEAGFDPSMFVLPSQIDYNQLTQRLNNVFRGSEQVTLNSTSEAANLSADQIWQRFGVIGLTSEASGLIAVADDPTAIVVAVVVYGSSVAVSNSNIAVVTSETSHQYSVNRPVADAAATLKASAEPTDIRYNRSRWRAGPECEARSGRRIPEAHQYQHWHKHPMIAGRQADPPSVYDGDPRKTYRFWEGPAAPPASQFGNHTEIRLGLRPLRLPRRQGSPQRTVHL